MAHKAASYSRDERKAADRAQRGATRRLVIEIEMEGEAFERFPCLETERIVRSVNVYALARGEDQTLHDVNGNACGAARMENPRAL